MVGSRVTAEGQIFEEKEALKAHPAYSHAASDILLQPPICRYLPGRSVQSVVPDSRLELEFHPDI